MCTILLFTMVIITIGSVAGDFKLLILHNNDMHSHFEETSATSGACQLPGSCYGGFARIKRTVDDIREQQKDKRNVLFLNAGDTFQGTPYYSVFKWKVVADFIDHIGIDVMSLGNHEFDDGPKGLAPYLNNIKTVSVTANIDITEEPILNSPQLKPYEILNVNGTNVAIIGYLTPNTTYLSETDKVKFFDEVEVLNKQIEELKKQNISIFIALGHSGYNIDLEIARRVPEIDLVIGGHTNTFLYNGSPPDLEKPIDVYPKIVTQASNRKVPVVQAYAYTKYLGYLEIDFDDKGEITHYSGNPILLNNDYPQDDGILNLLKPWQDKLGHITHEVIGKTKVFLDAHNRACKLNECNIGNLIVDAMIEVNSNNYRGPGWTDAPIAMIQAGAIRSSIDASQTDGNVTYGDVVTALPNEDELFKANIKGVHLRQALEFSVHRYSSTILEQVGEFLQLAGIRVTYNMSAESGKRVLSARVRCGNCNVPTYSELKDDNEYSLILTSFLKKGGDNYVALRDNIYNVTSLNTTDTDAVVSYIRKRTPVYPLITNRIKIVGIPPEPSPTTESPSSSTTIISSSTTETSPTITIEPISEESTASSSGTTTEITIGSSTGSTIQGSTGSSTTYLPGSTNTTDGSTAMAPVEPQSTEPTPGTVSPTHTKGSGATTLEYLTSLLMFTFFHIFKKL